MLERYSRFQRHSFLSIKVKKICIYIIFELTIRRKFFHTYLYGLYASGRHYAPLIFIFTLYTYLRTFVSKKTFQQCQFFVIVFECMKFSVITPAKTFHELYHNLNWHNYDFFTKKKRKYYYVKSNSKKKHFFHIQPKYNIFNSYPFLSPSSRSRFHYKRQSFPKQTFFQQNHIELQKTHSSPKLFHSITREVFRKKGEPISTF